MSKKTLMKFLAAGNRSLKQRILGDVGIVNIVYQLDAEVFLNVTLKYSK